MPRKGQEAVRTRATSRRKKVIASPEDSEKENVSSPANGRKRSASPAVCADETCEPRSKRRRLTDVEKLASLLEEFDVEVDTRCRQMMSYAESLTVLLWNTLHTEVMKLPKSIRQMPAGEFDSKYGGQVAAVAQEQVQKVIDAMVASPDPKVIAEGESSEISEAVRRSVRKAYATTKATAPTEKKDYSKLKVTQLKAELKKRNLGVGGKKADLIKRLEENDASEDETAFATPAALSRAVSVTAPAVTPAFDPRLPHTPRDPVVGERLMSLNGSPLGEFHRTTIATASTTEDAMRLQFTLGDGHVVTLGSPSTTVQTTSSLSMDARLEAMNKLSALQSQIASMMNSLHQ